MACAAAYTHRVMRGGSWIHTAREARATSRAPMPADHRDTDTGLRPSRRLQK